MLTVADLKVDTAERAIFGERRARYDQAAQAHLKKHFKDEFAAHGPDVTDRFIAQCYSTATSFGVERWCDHLSYLTVAVYLGAQFPRDPQHANRLRRAGWRGRQAARDMEALTVSVQHWQSLAALDVETPDTGFAYLADAMSHWLVEHDTPSAEEITDVLKMVWPNRTAVLDPVDLMEFSAAARQFASTLELFGADTYVFAVLAFHLGLRFTQDPRYGELAAALHPDKRSVMTRRSDVVGAIITTIEKGAGS